MSKMKWKMMLFGVVVACAFGGIALRFAWATPGQGITSTTMAGPVVLDEIDIHTDSVKIKTKGLSDGRVVEFHVGPGGHTGWHSHPGPVFVMVTAGALTKYGAGDPTPTVYPAGTGFVEQPGDVHIGRNEGNTNVELVAFFLTPLGAPVRIDEPEPALEPDE